MWKRLALWLFVINLGTAFGAGVYESRVVVPGWAALPPRTWPNTGLLFWVYVTTVPLTLLTALNAAAAWLTQGPSRPWHLASVGAVVVERLATFSYFLPTMLRLMGSEGPADAEVRATLSQWLLLGHMRHLLSFSGWLLALKALAAWRP